MDAIVQLVVPVHAPLPPLAFAHATLLIPTWLYEVPAIRVYGVAVTYIVLPGVVIDTVGSAPEYTMSVTAVLVLPARSVAVTVMLLWPCRRAIDAIVQLVVPVHVPDPPLALTQVTLCIPTWLHEVPAIVVYGVAETYVGVLAGVVIVTVGLTPE